MINTAMKQARKAIESLYTGTCTVFEYQEVKDPITKRTIHKEVMILENQPCRLSFKNITQISEGITPKASQIIKLFLDPGINIKPGSKIAVTQNNKSVEYKNSGEPAIYSNHQEIVLLLFEGWA
jgi:hypothetical protein